MAVFQLLVPLQKQTPKNVSTLLDIVFTARRYAKRGICRRRVSVCVCVCVSVCHTPVLYQNG